MSSYWRIEESTGQYYFPWPDSYKTVESASKAINDWHAAQKAAGRSPPDMSKFRLTEYTLTMFGPTERTRTVRVTNQFAVEHNKVERIV
jgi:hypothetical protein